MAGREPERKWLPITRSTTSSRFRENPFLAQLKVTSRSSSGPETATNPGPSTSEATGAVRRTVPVEDDHQPSFLDEIYEECGFQEERPPADSPKVRHLVLQTIKKLKDSSGSTLAEIMDYLNRQSTVDVSDLDEEVRLFLGEAVEAGTLVKRDRHRYAFPRTLGVQTRSGVQLAVSLEAIGKRDRGHKRQNRKTSAGRAKRAKR